MVVLQLTRARRAMLVILATGVWLIAAPVAGFADPAPSAPTPTAGVVSPRAPSAAEAVAGDRAQGAKDAADRRVGTLANSIAGESKHLATLSATASLAEQRFTAQQVVEASARIAEARAATRLTLAREQCRAAHDALVAIAVSSYQGGGGPGSIGTSSFASLLTVDNPSEVMGGAVEQRMLGDHQVDVVAQLTLAEQVLRSAEQVRQAALAAVASQTAVLDGIRRQADSAQAASSLVLSALRANLVKAKVGQKQADAALSTFLGGWSIADPARAGALNTQYEAIALEARHSEATPRGSHWTAAMGQTVVNRALQFLGTSYAWAGGDATGPTRGTCAGGSAHNDCHLSGFDCSGLALYAWAPYLSMSHFAATQYGYGTVHPAPTALLPGDLVFWSSNGAVAGIHHVAIYVGNGNIIQAPQSGDIVRITPLANVSSGYFGATRPLS